MDFISLKTMITKGLNLLPLYNEFSMNTYSLLNYSHQKTFLALLILSTQREISKGEELETRQS